MSNYDKHGSSRHLRLTEDQKEMFTEVAERYTDGNLSQAIRLLATYGYLSWYLTVKDKLTPEQFKAEA